MQGVEARGSGARPHRDRPRALLSRRFARRDAPCDRDRPCDLHAPGASFGPSRCQRRPSQAGERIVLRGPSGAGKTTLLALVLGLVRAEQGSVRIGDIDVATTHPSAWRDAIAWLPQHPHLFAGTIADNVRLGLPDATDADVREALAVTGLAVRRRAPRRDRHGGRRARPDPQRRSAPARSRWRGPCSRGCPIVLLDEPLAQLDARSRETVSDAIERCTRGRTVIIAAHALDNFPWAARSIDLRRGGGDRIRRRPCSRWRRRDRATLGLPPRSGFAASPPPWRRCGRLAPLRRLGRGAARRRPAT